METHDKPRSSATWLRVVAGIVVLATFVLTILLIAFARSPLRPVPSREWEGLFVCVLLTCAILAPTGGLYLFSRTRNPWWFLTLLPFFGVLVVWLLVSAVGPVPFH